MKSLGDAVMSGVLQNIGAYYRGVIDNAFKSGRLKQRRKLEAIYSTSNKRWEVIRKVRSQQESEGYDNDIAFPFLLLRVETKRVESQDSGKNPKSMYRQGIQIDLKDVSENAYVTVRPVPTIFDYLLTYLTDDFHEANAFSDAWILSSVAKKDLNFNLNYYGAIIPIQIEPELSISFPEKEDSIDVPNFYELTANFRVRGYVSEDSDINEIPIQNYVREINVTTNVSGIDETDSEEFVETENNEENFSISKPYD